MPIPGSHSSLFFIAPLPGSYSAPEAWRQLFESSSAVIPHSILAVTDFSAHGDNALSRAALLCAEHGAPLKHLRHPMPDAGSHTMRCSWVSVTASACAP